MKRKKSILTFLGLALCVQGALTQTVEDVNVSLSNLSSNNWFQNYDDNTKTVNNLNFEVLSDGNNSLDYVTPFVVKVYIYDGSNPTFVKSYNINDMNQLSALDFSNQTVDLSDLSLPAGSYRLGIYVDANDDIPNPPDDPSDNASLLQGDIQFTPGSSVSISEVTALNDIIRLFPNPATSELNIDLGESNVKINQLLISSINGKIVQTIKPDGKSNYVLDLSNFEAGIYILTGKSKDRIFREKFIVQ